MRYVPPVWTQRERICNLMRAAAQAQAWVTLREIASLTGYSEASISAQLRHLRKQAFGSYRVEKRRRECVACVDGRRSEPTPWEYHLRLPRQARRQRWPRRPLRWR